MQFFVLTKLTVFKVELDQSLTNPVSVTSIGSRVGRKTPRRTHLRYLGRSVTIGPETIRIRPSSKVREGTPDYEIGEVLALCLMRREVESFLAEVSDHPTCAPFNPKISTLRALEAIGCDNPLVHIQ